MKLTDFKALTFDCYGTLNDWEAGMFGGFKPLTSRVDRHLDRDAVLEAHARHESSQQAQTPAKNYSELLPIVYKRLAEEWSVSVSEDEAAAYGRSIKDWPAFSDSAGALLYLKKHFKLVILSNVDNRSFEASKQKLGVDFDAVSTAEDCGSYKPSDRHFEYMLQKLRAIGVERQVILHTPETMFPDHAPANRHGLKSCWIYRRHEQTGFGATMDPGEMPRYDFRFNSMAELVKAHQEALRA